MTSRTISDCAVGKNAERRRKASSVIRGKREGRSRRERLEKGRESEKVKKGGEEKERMMHV